VLSTRTSGAEGNRFGFEGGRVVKVDGTYHLFTSEMVGDPIWVRMKLGYWTSRDRLTWTRVATVRESSAEFTGADPRAALWSPLPVWDDAASRWNLFYVAYRSKPGDGTAFTLNYDGRIWRAISKAPGMKGIGGPYEDVGVVMQPGTDSLPWEGLQGTDSFFPWHVGERWYAMYGSARSERQPIEHWLVGLVRRRRSPAPGLASRPTAPCPLKRSSSRIPSSRLRPMAAGSLSTTAMPRTPSAGRGPPMASSGRKGTRWSCSPPRDRGPKTSARRWAWWMRRRTLHGLLHGVRTGAGLDAPAARSGRRDVRDWFCGVEGCI
jgi:hypothetical protein